MAFLLPQVKKIQRKSASYPFWKEGEEVILADTQKHFLVQFLGTASQSY